MKQVPGFMRTAAAPLLAALVLASASWMTAAANGPARLDANVLDQARGRNPGTALGQASCTGLQGLYPCSYEGQYCGKCGQNGYTVVVPGSLQWGYKVNPAVTVSCGAWFPGQCDAALNCSVGSSNGTNCTPPPQVVAQ
jgi:hypothetical protein